MWRRRGSDTNVVEVKIALGTGSALRPGGWLWVNLLVEGFGAWGAFSGGGLMPHEGHQAGVDWVRRRYCTVMVSAALTEPPVLGYPTRTT